MKKIAVFFLFLFLVLVLYSPLINKSFSSDDFEILRRVVFAEHGILIKGFFRPLSDITLYYLNYCFVGFNPLWYNVYNFISHACTSYIVFLVAGRIQWIPAENRRFFSWLSALLFITYPFHNEPVVWAVGRASLMAGLFGSLSILAAVSAIRPRLKYLLVCVFYFIAMSGYESVLVLPGIILLVIYDRKLPLRAYWPWVIWMGITLFIHLVVRIWISGVFMGTYGAEMISDSSKSYVMKYLKVLGRVLLPPMEHSGLLVALFAMEAIFLAGCVVVLWKRRREKPDGFSGIVRFGGMLSLALLIPLLFGMSTRTYEGDRLFYFPSIIVAWWLAWMISTLLTKRTAFIVAGGLLLYQLVFLIINIHNWRRASEITRQVISVIKDRPRPLRRVLVINIPQEYEGSHVLRNGFYDAFWWQGIDTSRIRAVNYITTEQMRAQPPVVTPVYKDGRWFIAPDISVGYTRGEIIADPKGSAGIHREVLVDTLTTDVYYWNKEKLLPLQ